MVTKNINQSIDRSPKHTKKSKNNKKKIVEENKLNPKTNWNLNDNDGYGYGDGNGDYGEEKTTKTST